MYILSQLSTFYLTTLDVHTFIASRLSIRGLNAEEHFYCRLVMLFIISIIHLVTRLRYRVKTEGKKRWDANDVF